MRWPVACVTLSMLVSVSAIAVPGAAPVELCRFEPPEYSAREIAAVKSYQACLASVGTTQTGNDVAQKCNAMVNAVSGRSGADERTVECGSGPDFRHCRVPVAIGWCTYDRAQRAGFPALYPCDELVRRYPDLRPAIDACLPLAEARERDVKLAEQNRQRCARAESPGYAIASARCRKVQIVVPPSAPRPQ